MATNTTAPSTEVKVKHSSGQKATVYMTGAAKSESECKAFFETFRLLQAHTTSDHAIQYDPDLQECRMVQYLPEPPTDRKT